MSEIMERDSFDSESYLCDNLKITEVIIKLLQIKLDNNENIREFNSSLHELAVRTEKLVHDIAESVIEYYEDDPDYDSSDLYQPDYYTTEYSNYSYE
jgi:hypothetical protein